MFSKFQVVRKFHFHSIAAGLFITTLLTSCNMQVGLPDDPAYPKGKLKATVTWKPNLESAVNQSGGGYRVYYHTSPNIDLIKSRFIEVSYASGELAPTSLTINDLGAATYYFKVVGFKEFRGLSQLTLGASSPEISLVIK